MTWRLITESDPGHQSVTGGHLHTLTSCLHNKELIWAITGHKMIHKHKTGTHKHGYIWNLLCCCISKTSFTSLNKHKHARRRVFVYARISKITVLKHLTPVPFTTVTSWQFRHDGIDIWKGDVCNDSSCVVSTRPLPRDAFNTTDPSRHKHTRVPRTSRTRLTNIKNNLSERIYYVYDWRLSKT